MLIDQFDTTNALSRYYIHSREVLFGIICMDIINHGRRNTLALDVSAIGISRP